jgi:hypothetical protein
MARVSQVAVDAFLNTIFTAVTTMLSVTVARRVKLSPSETTDSVRCVTTGKIVSVGVAKAIFDGLDSPPSDTTVK